MTRDPPDAILLVSDVLTKLNRRLVYEFAAKHRLPAIYEEDVYVRYGGLMSFGPDMEEEFDLAAGLVDRLLKGAQPTQLPVELPTRFTLSINLRTAAELGLTIPLHCSPSPTRLSNVDMVESARMTLNGPPEARAHQRIPRRGNSTKKLIICDSLPGRRQ
jgi:ABC-type uncharacterized transport system substrate-binding protein